jgi:type I restriction enzyme S subunit
MTAQPRVMLGEIAKLNPRLENKLTDDCVVSFLGMSDVSADGTTREGLDRSYSDVRKSYTPFRSGDILVAKITPCFENGKIAQAETKQAIAFGSTEFHVIRAESDIADPRYILHYLRQGSIRTRGEKRMTGSAGQRRVPVSFLEALEVPLPSLPEQRRIAAVLDRVDELRALRNSAVSLIDELTRSLFDELLNLDQSRRISKVDEVGQVQSGLTVNGSRERYPIRVPYLRVANVMRGRLDLSEIKTLGAAATEIERTALSKGDLLVVEGHGNADEIGRVAQWDGSISPCVHQNHLIRIRLDPSKILPTVACHYLNSHVGRRHLLRSAKTTSGLNTINVSQVRSTPLLIPQMSSQLQFLERLTAAEGLKEIHSRALVELDALFASLQHRAFRGEL